MGTKRSPAGGRRGDHSAFGTPPPGPPLSGPERPALAAPSAVQRCSAVAPLAYGGKPLAYEGNTRLPDVRARVAPRRNERGTAGDSQVDAGGRNGHRAGSRLASDRMSGTAWREARLRALYTDGVRLDRDDLLVLALLAEGMPLRSVSRRMAMSDRTIRRRVRAICEQLGVKATVQAIVWAARRGLV